MLHTSELFRLEFSFSRQTSSKSDYKPEIPAMHLPCNDLHITTPCVVKTAYEQKRFKREPLADNRTQQTLLPPLQRAPAPAEILTSWPSFFCMNTAGSRADAFLPRVSNQAFNGRRTEASIVEATSGPRRNKSSLNRKFISRPEDSCAACRHPVPVSSPSTSRCRGSSCCKAPLQLAGAGTSQPVTKLVLMTHFRLKCLRFVCQITLIFPDFVNELCSSTFKILQTFLLTCFSLKDS